jgi:hypothetical protein
MMWRCLSAAVAIHRAVSSSNIEQILRARLQTNSDMDATGSWGRLR